MAGPWEAYAPAESGPWNEYAPATANPNLAAQGVKSEGAREGLRGAADFVSSRDPGIDYKTGIPSAMFRAGFSRMSNDAEKENYLDRSVGKGKWGKDSFGAFYIKPEGLGKFGVKSNTPVSIDEQTATRYDVADIAGDAPAIAGGVGMAMSATGLGAPAGMALAGLGAAGGKSIDELIKNAQGYQRKSPGEVASTLGKEAVAAAVGEGVARVLAPAGKFLLGPGAHRMTPEKAELAKSAQDQGFAIRPGSVTDAPILARWEGMVRNIFGDLYKGQNNQAAEAGLKRLGISGGVKASKEEAGEVISSSIKAARVNFSEMMGKQYDKVDELVGNAPIIPTAPIKKQAEELLAAMSKTEKGKVVGGQDALIKDILEMGDAVTVKQAQRLRTILRESADSPNLVPDVAKHDARLLKKSIDDAFDLAAQSTSKDAKTDAAIRMLRMTDAAYKQGISKFDNSVVTAITKKAGKSGSVDADMVVDYLVKPGRAVRLRNVKSLVSDDAWAKVKSSHAQDLLSSVVKGTDDPLTSIFDGRALRDTLDKYGADVLREVHGKEWTDSAYKYANSLMLAEKKMSLSGGIVAANIALHPVQNLPKLVWLRAVAKVMEQPGTFKYLTEGIRLDPSTKAGASAINRFATQVMANARDETGSAKVTVTSPE